MNLKTLVDNDHISTYLMNILSSCMNLMTISVHALKYLFTENGETSELLF